MTFVLFLVSENIYNKILEDKPYYIFSSCQLGSVKLQKMSHQLFIMCNLLFHSQVFDESGTLHLNLTSDEPQFSIQALEPGKTYVIRISSYNEKGRSPPVSLTASTLKVAEKRMGEFRPSSTGSRSSAMIHSIKHMYFYFVTTILPRCALSSFTNKFTTTISLKEKMKSF